MPQDAFTLRYLSLELNNLLSGGKINKIVQPDNDEVVFTVYNGRTTFKLCLNVNPSCPRIGIIDQEKVAPSVAPNFCMLLRKYLLNGSIEKIELIGFDRIIKISILPYDEYFDSRKKELFVELMGRYSNVILTEDGKILGANRGINVFDNGVRPLFVGQKYVFPPVGDKKLPTDLSLIEYFNNFVVDDFAKYICDGVQGLALSTAKYIVNQFAAKNPIIKNNEFGEKFYKFFVEILFNSLPNPCVKKSNEKLEDVSVFPYCDNAEYMYFDFMYKAEQYYFSEREKQRNFCLKKERYFNIVTTAIKKAKKKLVAISSREKDAINLEENKICGELILANIYKLKQGQSSCELYNYYEDKQAVVALNPNLSPADNAEFYYKKYAKQKRTLEAIKPQKEMALQEVDYLTSILEELNLVEDICDLDAIKTELEDCGLLKTQVKGKKQNNKPNYREYLIDGFTVLVGRNNTENDQITFSANKNDVWLHVKGYHSSHVIVKTGDAELNESIIKKCASICAYYSQCRNEQSVAVDYTLKKYVKKPPKSKPGKVIFDNFKSVAVKPDKLSDFLKKI